MSSHELEPPVEIIFKNPPEGKLKDHMLTDLVKDEKKGLVGTIDLRTLMLYGHSWPHQEVVEVKIDRAYVAEAKIGSYKRGRSLIYVGEDHTVSLTSPSIRTFVRTWGKVVNRQIGIFHRYPR